MAPVNSARRIDGLHEEALTSRSAGKPLVEGHDVQRGRQSLRGDDGGGKLQRPTWPLASPVER